MRRFITRRLLLSILTLAIIIVIITLIPNLAPGDPARKIAGGTASPERLQAVTESLGLNKSVLQQLSDVVSSTIRFDFGDSFTRPGTSVTSLVTVSLWNSTKLVVFALVLVLPISIAGGLIAAYRRDTWLDRVIVNAGVALSSLPEFVVGVLFLALLAVPFSFFKVIADPPDGAGFFTQLQFLLLPALTVLTVYFGYIARITRASTITSLEADYARTAFMRGLSTWDVFRKHVLRNSLVPTVAVVGTQLGYLFGGMVGLELIYNYPGLGRLIFDAVDAADYPVLRGGVITVAIIYMVATLSADLIIAWMNPRARLSLSEA
ncbi:MAG: ABC transporter permease [Acidimicrobiia bacterium]|nr:ABC transporter permease [Acidimicrobiia bacterium]NNF63314.1 ABC transporter permease [Acidimicrobiia bacterium]